MASCPVQWRTESRAATQGTSRTPGWHPEETEALTARRGTLKPAWSASTHSEGKGPEDPGQRVQDSVAADPSDTTLRRRTTFSGTIRVDGRTRQPSRRTDDSARVETVQITVVVAQLQFSLVVHFLPKIFYMPAVVCSSTRWSMSLLCCAMGNIFAGAIHRRL